VKYKKIKIFYFDLPLEDTNFHDYFMGKNRDLRVVNSKKRKQRLTEIFIL